MSLREVTKVFYATRLLPEADDSCAGLEGYDTSGDVKFDVGLGPLNDGFGPGREFVNGKLFIRFTFGISAYCVEASVYEESTRKIDQGKQKTQ